MNVADTRDESLETLARKPVELGMADTLITRLSNIREIIVRPTSAVRKYTGLDQDPIAAGREQRVDAVLDASLQKVGERIRVTARLIRVEDGVTLWAYKCDEQCTDLFELQDVISEKVTAALALKLTGEAQNLLTKRYTDNPEAYRLYLLGQYHYDKRRVEDIEKAINYFEQAVALDPKYALAYVALCESYASLGDLGALPPKSVMPKTNAALAKALENDDQLAEAHNALAECKYIWDWDWSGAEREYKRALELNPNSAGIHHSYAWYLMNVGRFDEAVAEIKRAQELDPVSLFFSRNVGQILYFARRYDEAIEALQKTLDMDSNYSNAHNWMANAYEQKGNYDQAVENFIKPISAGSQETATALREAYAVSGWRGFWQKRLELAKERLNQTYVNSYNIASIYARLADKNQVFAWLEKACKLLQRIGLAEE